MPCRAPCCAITTVGAFRADVPLIHGSVHIRIQHRAGGVPTGSLRRPRTRLPAYALQHLADGVPSPRGGLLAAVELGMEPA